MTKLLVGIAAAALWFVTPGAQAQTPPQQEVAPTPSVKLTLEQRHVIRELIKDLKVEPSKTAVRPSLGDALPQDVALQPMPPDVGRKVPQIKAHRFLVTADEIVIVDPKDNTVAELIELKAN